MSENFRLGLIGIGDMAEVHAAAAQRLGVSMAVAAGQNPSRAKALAQSTGAEFYDNVEQMLADPQVTAVDLCVPNDLHRRFAEQSLRAGKHVLCEKPVSLSLEDADAILTAAKSTGRTLMVGHLIRFWPEYRRLREGLHNSEFGRVDWLSLRRLTGVLSATAGREEWRTNVARSGGAALDLQIHDLDFACWAFGTPTSVVARGVRSSGGTWDHVSTLATFGESTVMVEASFLMQGAPFEMSFHAVTERGTVSYRYSPENFALHGLHGESETEEEPKRAASLRLFPAGSDPIDLYTPEVDSFQLAIDGEIREFVTAVTEGREPLCTGEDARRSLAVALGSLRSCVTGESVTGPFEH
ncbi:MAG: Gfo/Idh/MocA family protein [Thermomicrobiales bacterium]